MTVSYSTFEDSLSGETSTSMFNKTTSDGVISFIPVDWGNSDYQQYLKWVREGNTALTGIPLLTGPA